MTKDYKWRTAVSSGEGTTTRYVDGNTGSDLFGTGTMANPYRTLGRAYRVSDTKPTTIICRGCFSEMLVDGNHICSINADYYGAAVFDGRDQFLIYGFRHKNMIFRDTCIGNTDMVLYDSRGSGSLAGVGSASNAVYVGNAFSVYGVAGSPNLMHKVALYMGVIGGNTACKYLGFSRVKNHPSYPIQLGGYQNSAVLQNSTVYGVEDISHRVKTGNTSYLKIITSSIFAKFAMIANDVKFEFRNCLFAADVKWYYLSGSNGKTGAEEIVIEGNDSQSKIESLQTQLMAIYVANNIAEANRYIPTFVNCIFSEQTSGELFNNPEDGDLTLRVGSEAITSEYEYIGAFPPAINIPILSNSLGIAETWDETTCSGCISVTNDAICLNESNTSMNGEIMSKVIQVDTSRNPLNGLYALTQNRFADHYAYLNNIDAISTKQYMAGEPLPIGRYVVKGAILYKDVNIDNDMILVVSEENTTFADEIEDSFVRPIIEPNIIDVIYVRCRGGIYAKCLQTESLQRGATYINYGNSNIMYRNREIVPGESFVAMGEDYWSGPAGYDIGILFDDTRVPDSDWVPAQMFGEYFALKENGAIKLDGDDIPVGSGNYLAWQTAANGGYRGYLPKAIMNQAFVQFKIAIKRYDRTSA